MTYRFNCNPFLYILFMLSFVSCSPKVEPDWSQFLPEQTVLVHWGDSDPNGSLRAEISELVGTSVLLHDIMGDSVDLRPVVTALIPESVDQLSALWVFDASSTIEMMLDMHGWGGKGSYTIREGHVDRYESNGLSLASSRTSKWVIVSTSSRTIEQALRAYDGTIDRIRIENTPGFHLNVGEIGRLISPLANTSVRAVLTGVLRGLGTVLVRPPSETKPSEWVVEIPLATNKSRLVRYLTRTSNDKINTFSVFPGMALSVVWLDPYGDESFDDMRTAHTAGRAVRSATAKLASHVLPEVGLYMTDAPSASIAYVRRADMVAVGDIFADLYQSGVIDGDGDIFIGRDPALAKAICSDLCNMSRYTIGLRDDGIVISTSETLTRRLMVVDASLPGLDTQVPSGTAGTDERSGSYGWADIASLIAATKANGWMVADKPVPSLLRRFASIAYSVRTVGDTLTLNLNLNSETSSVSRTDLVLAWQYPLKGDQLISTPVVSILNQRPTIIATTKTGRVLAFGSEGNLQFEVTTGTQVPVGEAVVYDWYTNRSPVVLQAAGSTIYAWSPSGTLLPSFPFVVEAPISAPISLTDIDGNAEPEILVPTGDARLHLINRDGRGVTGWPVYTDGNVVDKPIPSHSNGLWTVEVTTEYATEVFDRLGQRLSSRPHLDEVFNQPDTLITPRTRSVFDGSKPMLYGQFPVIADIDGDGRTELIVVLDGQLRCYRMPVNHID